MVSSWSLLMIAVTLVLSILFPVIFLLILMRRRKGIFSAWIVGALGFVVPQMLIRIPLLQFAATQSWYQTLARDQFVWFALGLALTAGLFETTGRWVVLRFALRKRQTFMTGLAAGAGHGAAESIGLVGLTYINNLVISLMLNAGVLQTMIPDPAIANQVTAALTGTAPSLFLAAGFERVFTMALHAALSTLLCYLIWKGRSFLGFILVVALHATVDFLAVILQAQGLSSWAIEGGLAVVAIVSIGLIIWIKPRFQNEPEIQRDTGEEAV